VYLGGRVTKDGGALAHMSGSEDTDGPGSQDDKTKDDRETPERVCSISVMTNVDSIEYVPWGMNFTSHSFSIIYVRRMKWTWEGHPAEYDGHCISGNPMKGKT